METVKTTRYHHLSKGDVFTLNQLKNKLAEWSEEVSDNGETTYFGWRISEDNIPEVGEVFTLTISNFFTPITYDVKVLRQKYNHFLVVERE